MLSASSARQLYLCVSAPPLNSSVAGSRLSDQSLMREKTEPCWASGLTALLHTFSPICPGEMGRGPPNPYLQGSAPPPPTCQALSAGQEAHAVTNYSEMWFFVTNCSVVRVICISVASTSWPGLKWSTLLHEGYQTNLSTWCWPPGPLR